MRLRSISMNNASGQPIPLGAIWAQRDAHETRQEAQGRTREGYVLAAAQ